MKQQQTILQTSDIRRHFLNKLWQTEELQYTHTYLPPVPMPVHWIKKDINIAGKTIILQIRANNNWSTKDVFITMNRTGHKTERLRLWSSGGTINVIKFEGFNSFSLFIDQPLGGTWYLDFAIIYIDQTEDMEFYTQSDYQMS